MKKQMIKVLATLTVASMLLAGCGSKEENHDTSAPSTESSLVEDETTPSTEANTETIPKDEPSEEPEQPGEPQAPAHTHDYKGVMTKEPGCYYARKPGEMTYTCSCGDSYTEVLEFLPCSDLRDGIRVTIKEPDCQHEGRTAEHCKYCGNELYPGTIPETEHVSSNWLEIPSQGKKYKVCVNCGITLEKELLE